MAVSIHHINGDLSFRKKIKMKCAARRIDPVIVNVVATIHPHPPDLSVITWMIDAVIRMKNEIVSGERNFMVILI
jgi:hypothetical protein